MQFKSIWLEKQLIDIDKRISIILFFLDFYTMQNWKKEIIVTDLIRTREEQENIYKDTSKYKDKPVNTIPNSVHQYGRGADIRVHHLEKYQIDGIMNILDSIPYGDGIHKTALLHDIGNGQHIHVQVRYK